MTNEPAPAVAAIERTQPMLLWPAGPPAAVEIATKLGRRRELQPGDELQMVGGPAWVGLVASGLVRGFVASVSGREATMLYAGPGAILGEGLFYRNAKGTLEAMVPTIVFELPARQLRAITEIEAQFKLLLLGNLEDVVSLLVAELSSHAFGDLKARVARHLLALAEVDRASNCIEVHATRAELASAVASTTDAVTRVVRAMASERLVSVRRGRIELLDPARLATMATTL